MINYTNKTINEQYNIIENIAKKYAIHILYNNEYEIELISEFLEEENNAIIIPTNLLLKRDYKQILITCIELSKELTSKTDCIFYVCIESPNDNDNECIVINCNYNFNKYC